MNLPNHYSPILIEEIGERRLEVRIEGVVVDFDGHLVDEVLASGLAVGLAVGDEVGDFPNDLVQGFALASIFRTVRVGGFGVVFVLDELRGLHGFVDADDVPGLARVIVHRIGEFFAALDRFGTEVVLALDAPGEVRFDDRVDRGFEVTRIIDFVRDLGLEEAGLHRGGKIAQTAGGVPAFRDLGGRVDVTGLEVQTCGDAISAGTGEIGRGAFFPTGRGEEAVIVEELAVRRFAIRRDVAIRGRDGQRGEARFRVDRIGKGLVFAFDDDALVELVEEAKVLVGLGVGAKIGVFLVQDELAVGTDQGTGRIFELIKVREGDVLNLAGVGTSEGAVVRVHQVLLDEGFAISRREQGANDVVLVVGAERIEVVGVEEEQGVFVGVFAFDELLGEVLFRGEDVEIAALSFDKEFFIEDLVFLVGRVGDNGPEGFQDRGLDRIVEVLGLLRIGGTIFGLEGSGDDAFFKGAVGIVAFIEIAEVGFRVGEEDVVEDALAVGIARGDNVIVEIAKGVGEDVGVVDDRLFALGGREVHLDFAGSEADGHSGKEGRR